MRPAGIGVWDRGGLGMGYILRKTYECFAIAVMPEWKRVKTDVPDVWKVQWTPADRQNDHPTEKPIGLFERAIDLIGGNIIFDPFMGSGTVCLACMKLGRNFIGCEIDPVYYAIAEKRIRKAAAQRLLF